MSKDPAALFYFNDWMGGTATLTRHQKGCYIDLLCVQFNSGPLSLDEIKTVLGSDFGSSWPAIQKKFKSENGLYFNERLALEKYRRNTYTSSRRSNANSQKHMPKHMEDVNENVLSINKSLEYLKNLPESDLMEFNRSYEASKSQIKAKAEDLYLWCGTNNRKKANYRMFLLSALRRDFKKRQPLEVKAPVVDTRAPLPKEVKDIFAEGRKSINKLNN